MEQARAHGGDGEGRVKMVAAGIVGDGDEVDLDRNCNGFFGYLRCFVIAVLCV